PPLRIHLSAESYMRRIAMLLVPILVAACLSTEDDSLTLDPTDSNVSGSFALSTINGSSLPIIASVNTVQETDLLSDTVTISSNGTWTETSVFNVTTFPGNTASTQISVIGGTYTIGNQQINFVQTTGTGAVAFAGSVKGTRLTVVFGGSQF